MNESLQLFRSDNILYGALYAGGSVFLGLIAVFQSTGKSTDPKHQKLKILFLTESPPFETNQARLLGNLTRFVISLNISTLSTMQ